MSNAVSTRTPRHLAAKSAEETAKINPDTGFSDDQIIAHVTRSIERSHVAKNPFDHSILDKVFPEAFYEQLSASFPSPETNMNWLNEVRARRTNEKDTYSDRRLSLTPTSMDHDEYALVPASLRQACSVMTNSKLSNAMMKPFMPIIQERVGKFIEQQDLDPKTSRAILRPSCEFIYDRTGFNLAPHTDGAKKIMTALIYIATEGDPETLGTHVYQANNPEELPQDVKNGKTGLALSKVTSMGHAPYRPNVMLLFARSDKSFHGVPPSSSTHPRRLIQASISIDGFRVPAGATGNPQAGNPQAGNPQA